MRPKLRLKGLPPLSKKYHPDITAPGAEEKFKEITEAYEVLGDDKTVELHHGSADGPQGLWRWCWRRQRLRRLW